MPAKSKHGRGKHPHNKKRSKIRQIQAVKNLEPATGDMPGAAGTAVTASSPPVQAQKRSTISAALPLHYEYIGSDLKRIGILTAIIVIILIVLYIFLK